MKNSKVLIISAIAVTTIGLGVIAGTGYVSAQESLDSYPPLIQSLASKFNLNPDEVSQVLEDNREDRMDEHLDRLVADEAITEEQIPLILEMREEFRENIESIRSQELTQEERESAMHELREEVKVQLEENEILNPGIVFGRGAAGSGQRMGMGGTGSGGLGKGMGMGDGECDGTGISQ